MARTAPTSAAISEGLAMMFCPNSSLAKADRTMVASLTLTSATKYVTVSLPVPVWTVVISTEAVSLR